MKLPWTIKQEELQKHFKPVTIKHIVGTLGGTYCYETTVMVPTETQLGALARDEAFVRENGSITIADAFNKCGDYSPHKSMLRLKRKGIIGEVVMEQNANSKGKHARYMLAKGLGKND